MFQNESRGLKSAILLSHKPFRFRPECHPCKTRCKRFVVKNLLHCSSFPSHLSVCILIDTDTFLSSALSDDLLRLPPREGCSKKNSEASSKHNGAVLDGF